MDTTYIEVPKGLTTDGLLGKRYLARAIDSVVMTIAAVVPFAVLSAIFDPKGDVETGLLALLSFLPVWIAYGGFLEASSWQATIGKKCFGLRVYAADGGRLDVAQACLRALVKDGPFFLLGILPVGRAFTWLWLVAHLVVIHRSPVCQAIHDRVAGAWVAAPESTTRLHLT